MGIKLNKSRLESYLFTIISCIFYALAINLFIKPNNIVGGGVTGIALLINRFFPWGVGLIAYVLNIPIMIMSFRIKDFSYTLRCLIVTTILNFLIDALVFLPPMTDNPLIGAGYGGVFLGISVGINYRYNVSSGGTELLGQLLITRFKNMTIGKILIIIDGSIVLFGSLILHNPENVLLALIMIFVSGKVSDLVVNGFDCIRMCYIITAHEEKVASELMKKSSRGITKINGIGMYSRKDYSVLMTAVTKQQFTKLKESVIKADKNALVIIINTSEVLGKGFK
ncbi:membrane protein [Vallitalea longa]|uniref:Membrane protein n=1 Tax=Vallitalea longa TaxID=2936439 RepID=A0A9W5YHV5_9FIRM|nr:YitT family protein [Vallitalea longa]GKX31528.1 membrane protein [Vallitalea longa]